MKFRDIIQDRFNQVRDICQVCGQTPCNCTNIKESEMKFQALAMAKEIHTNLASITFIEMLSVMSPDNPAVKEVQDLETKLNQLTGEVGEFIQKYIPNVADAEAGDDSEIEDDEEETKKPVKAVKQVKESANGTKLVFSKTGSDGVKYNVMQDSPTDYSLYKQENGKSTHIDTYSSLARAKAAIEKEIK